MNTRQKLSWTLLGVALFFGIAAVSTDTTFFKNLSLSGSLKLSGQPEELTVAGGALLFDGNPVGGGGESLWTTNSDGWITPAGGEYLTNTLVFKSGLADDGTNVAAVVDSVSPQTIDGGGLSLVLRNQGTNEVEFPFGGGMSIGRGAAAQWVSDWGSAPTIGVMKNAALGDSGKYMFGLGSSMAGSIWDRGTSFVIDGHTNTASMSLNADNASGKGPYHAWYVGQGGAETLEYSAGYTGTNSWSYRPLQGGSTTTFFLGSIVPKSAGNLLEVQNVQTNKFAVAHDGRIITQGGTAITPATADATGTAGTIVWDADYIYICVATDTWKRVAIATWP